MAKKNDRSFLREVASFTGHFAGSVGGVIEAAADLRHHLGQPKPDPRHKDVRFEESDFHTRGVIIGGACFLAGMWLTVGLLFFYFVSLKNYRAEVSPPTLPATRSGVTLPPEPRLQSSPEQDLQTFRARKDWELTHYYWLDRSKGRVAIPIEEAMRIVAQHGLPAQNGAPNSPLTPPEEGSRLTGFEGKVQPEPR
ncbi:MAG: hypothetical protein ACJ74Y_06480 [Bryobacteraceae bacterium]